MNRVFVGSFLLFLFWLLESFRKFSEKLFDTLDVESRALLCYRRSRDAERLAPVDTRLIYRVSHVDAHLHKIKGHGNVGSSHSRRLL